MRTHIKHFRFHQHQTKTLPEIPPPIRTLQHQPHNTLHPQFEIIHFDFYHHHHRIHSHHYHQHHHHTNINPFPHATQHLSSTQVLLTLNIPVIIHHSLHVAETLAVGTLVDSHTMLSAAEQGTHNHLAFLKTII